LLVGVALHELTHAMGRVPYGPQPDIFDLFRFTSPGARLFLNGATAPAAYFSLDGGTTKVADYGQTSDASDFLNSGVQGSNDPFNEFYNGNTVQTLTAIDLKQLDALGFHLTSNQPTVIEAFGSTSLVQVGGNYYFDPVGGGTGPEFQYRGSAVTVGEFGNIEIIGAEQISGGYEVALHVQGADQYTVWDTDSQGSFVSNATGGVFVSGTSNILEGLETSFHQDLNGDGTIGVPSGSSVATLAVIAAAAGSSVNDTFTFLQAAAESPVAGKASAPDPGVFSNPSNGNQLAAFWSDLGSGHAQALFQMAGSGHTETAEAGNHDGRWVAEFMHGFILH
jgi:hypothetical protein